MLRIVRFLLLPAVAVILLAQPALAQTKLVADVYFPRKVPLFPGYLKKLADDTAKATNGRVLIEFSAGRLSSSKRQYDSVVKGVSDVALGFVGWQRKSLLLPQIAQLPFTTTTAGKAGPALWRTHKKFFERAGEYKNVKLLSYAMQPPAMIYTSKKAVRRVADFKGLKIRSAAGVAARIIETLGATVVTSSGPQIFEFVSKGVVDGIISNDDSIGSFRITKFLKYRFSSPKGFGTAVWSIMMNKKKWDGLSKANQQAIDSIAGENLARSGGATYDIESNDELKVSKAAGIQFIEAAGDVQADIKRRLAFMQDAWFKLAAKRNVDGPAALKFYLAQQE